MTPQELRSFLVKANERLELIREHIPDISTNIKKLKKAFGISGDKIYLQEGYHIEHVHNTITLMRGQLDILRGISGELLKEAYKIHDALPPNIPNKLKTILDDILNETIRIDQIIRYSQDSIANYGYAIDFVESLNDSIEFFSHKVDVALSLIPVIGIAWGTGAIATGGLFKKVFKPTYEFVTGEKITVEKKPEQKVYEKFLFKKEPTERPESKEEADLIHAIISVGIILLSIPAGIILIPKLFRAIGQTVRTIRK